MNNSDPSGKAFYSMCGASTSQGVSVASCDIAQYLQQEYGALPGSGFATVIGTITGTFIGGAVGSVVPILGTIKGAAVVGGLALKEELQNDYGYLNAGYITISEQTAVEMVYLDLNKTGLLTNFNGQSYVSCFSGIANLCDDIPQIVHTAAWATFYDSLAANLVIRTFFMGDLKQAASSLINGATLSSYQSRQITCS